MENITKRAYETIRQLILESEWGRTVTNNELFDFLFSEIYEFLEGCNKEDKDNILEEASDVLMILLYIVIKNVDNQKNNLIEELLYRLNTKLRTRYSIFFEGNQGSEMEEQHWIQAKHIEKEILHYLFCPDPNCPDYARANKGNMIIDGFQVKCRSCGYTAKCSSDNTLFYTTKSRRKLFDTLDNSYIGYLNGTYFYADDYFNSHRQDYIKIVRYWVSNKSGSLALTSFFTSKHAVSEETFDEFLMHPLRNQLKYMYNCQTNPLSAAIEINDLMIKCVNRNYTMLRNKFCGGKNTTKYYDIWINYIKYLLKSMTLPVSYETIALDNQTLSPSKKQLLPLNSYILHITMKQDKKTDVYLKQFSTDDRGNGAILQADISACKSNMQVGQVLISVILKFNLQHIPRLRCVFFNEAKGVDRQDLSEFLKDLFPMLELSAI